jgi:endonuclease/exonuclease/phosphatase family metal-dependent hydrolase
MLVMTRTDRAFTPHAVHWVRAQSVRSGVVFEVDNTHLGISPWREKRTARELLEVLDRDRADAVQILSGDFNSTPHGTLLRALTRTTPGSGEGFRDGWTLAERRVGSGTFHWGLGLAGPRIDYVLMRPARRVLSASVMTQRRRRALVSDHAPLTFEIDLESPAR